MQHHVVVGVAQCAEDVAFGGARRGQQGQGLVAVAGEHHLVEALDAGRAVQGDALGITLHALHRAVQADVFGEAGTQRRHVAARAAGNDPPLRAIADRQQAVVLEEAHEELQGELQHVGQRHGPDRRAHRHDVVVDEALAVAALLQVLAERQVGGDALFGEVELGLAVEAQDVAQHAPEGRAQQVAALGEEAVEVVAVVFGAAGRVMHREAHLGGLRGDAELVQQADEVGVGPVVEHDEAGVDGEGLALHLDIHRMGMAADPVTGLEQGDLVLALQQVGAGQAGDAAADDGDFHECDSVRESRLPSASCRPLGRLPSRRRMAMKGPGKAMW